MIAYNVTLATGDLAVAQAIARTIRESSGGLPGVQARGFGTADSNVVQVSMNLLDTRLTGMALVFERIREEALRRGVRVLESELVGLAPAEAVAEVAREALHFARLDASSVLETRLLEQALAAVEQR